MTWALRVRACPQWVDHFIYDRPEKSATETGEPRERGFSAGMKKGQVTNEWGRIALC
jgi:hypothetical protein